MIHQRGNHITDAFLKQRSGLCGVRYGPHWCAGRGLRCRVVRRASLPPDAVTPELEALVVLSALDPERQAMPSRNFALAAVG